jgi:hypothetical protein
MFPSEHGVFQSDYGVSQSGYDAIRCESDGFGPKMTRSVAPRANAVGTA